MHIVAHHEKTDLKVFVVVIPKKCYSTAFIVVIVGVIPKEGLAGPQPAKSSLGMTTTKTLRYVFLVAHVILSHLHSQ